VGDRIVVGHIMRAHGIRGEVAVRARTDVPERRFAVGAVLYCDHPEVPELVVAASRPHSDRMLVSFEGVADRAVAEALQGSVLSIDADQIGSAADESDDDAEAWWDHELVGLSARTVDGQELGTVTEVAHNPGGELLVIARAGGRELLVPFVSAIVPTVDPAGGFVVIDPPPGLLEL
jgi:16S rRNA processing protein RimM